MGTTSFWTLPPPLNLISLGEYEDELGKEEVACSTSKLRGYSRC